MAHIFALEPLMARMGDYARLFRLAVLLVWRASPWLLAGMSLLIMLQALLPPLQLALTKVVIDQIAAQLQLTSTLDPLTTLLPLPAAILLAALLVALNQLAAPIANILLSLAGDRLVGITSEQVIAAANRWPGLAYFENPALIDEIERVRRRADRLGLELITSLGQMSVSLVTTGVLLLALGALHPLAPLLLVLAALPQIARQWHAGARLLRYLYAQTPYGRQMQHCRYAMLAPEFAQDVRLYELGSFFRRRYDQLYDRSMDDMDRLRQQTAAPLALYSALAATTTGLIYVFLVWQIAQGVRSLGDLTLYGGAAVLAHRTLLQIGLSMGTLPATFSEALASLLRVLDTKPDLPLPTDPRPVLRPIRQGIVFERVSFAYPGSTQMVLRDLSLTIARGSCVALVGHNGAGKTTIIKLLLRLYDPTEGRILIDGVDLRAYDLEDLRRAIGVIFQDFVRYELTAGENIGLGQVEALGDQARLLAAAERAGAAELIARLPRGLDTPLGREIGGRELSGGEWQKLALARAFVRDSQVLVLDEPTAALDTQTEYEIYQRFHDLTRDRTSLLISHRFSTVRMADMIYCLEHGGIAEHGSHNQLLQRGGLYSRLYRLQASQYLDLQA